MVVICQHVSTSVIEFAEFTELKSYSISRLFVAVVFPFPLFFPVLNVCVNTVEARKLYHQTSFACKVLKCVWRANNNLPEKNSFCLFQLF